MVSLNEGFIQAMISCHKYINKSTVYIIMKAELT